MQLTIQINHQKERNGELTVPESSVWAKTKWRSRVLLHHPFSTLHVHPAPAWKENGGKKEPRSPKLRAQFHVLFWVTVSRSDTTPS